MKYLAASLAMFTATLSHAAPPDAESVRAWWSSETEAAQSLEVFHGTCAQWTTSKANAVVAHTAWIIDDTHWRLETHGSGGEVIRVRAREGDLVWDASGVMLSIAERTSPFALSMEQLFDVPNDMLALRFFAHQAAGHNAFRKPSAEHAQIETIGDNASLRWVNGNAGVTWNVTVQSEDRDDANKYFASTYQRISQGANYEGRFTELRTFEGVDRPLATRVAWTGGPAVSPTGHELRSVRPIAQPESVDLSIPSPGALPAKPASHAGVELLIRDFREPIDLRDAPVPMPVVIDADAESPRDRYRIIDAPEWTKSPE